MCAANRWLVGEWVRPWVFEDAEPLTEHGSYDCGWCGGFIPKDLEAVQCIGRVCLDMVMQEDTYFFCPTCSEEGHEFCRRCIEEEDEDQSAVDPDDLWDDDVPANEPEIFRKEWWTEVDKTEVEEFVYTHMSGDVDAFIAAYKDDELQYYDVYNSTTDAWTHYLNKNRVALGMGRRRHTDFGGGGGDGGGLRSLPADILEMIYGIASGCNFLIMVS